MFSQKLPYPSSFEAIESSSLCVETETISNLAISTMKGLAVDRAARIQNHVFFPMDNRLFNDVQLSKYQCKRLAKATLATFSKSAILQKGLFGIFPVGKIEIDSVILGTRHGDLFCIKKNEQVHKRLRKFCQLFRLYNTDRNKLSPPKDCFELVDENFAILYLPNFLHDRTFMRRARYIYTCSGFTFFLELDTGNVRMIRTTSELRTTSMKNSIFSESSCITQFQFDNTVEQMPREMLLKLLRVVHAKKLRVLRHEPLNKSCWIPIVEELIENPQLDEAKN